MKKCKLITVFDPLCGWCYGFGMVLQKLHQKYAELLDFDILSGGMITGSAVGPLSNMAGFIKKAYPAVEASTGVQFGPGFLEILENGNATFSSLEPSNVLSLVKELFPKDSIAASVEIQHLIYFEGINPVDYKAYLPIFRKRNVQDNLVLERLNSSETSQLSVLEFAQVHQWGIKGFPACIIETPAGKLFGISNGYLPLTAIEPKLKPFLLPGDS